MKRIIAFCLVLIFIFVLVFSSTSYADPMALSQIASIAYALGASWGLEFTMTGMDAAGVNGYLSNNINSWLAGRSISDVFGTTPAQIIAGKLVVPHLIYNAIREFFSDYTKKYNNTSLPAGRYDFVQTGGKFYFFNGFPKAGYYEFGITNISTGETTYKQGSGYTNDRYVFAGIAVGSQVLGYMNQYHGSTLYVRDVVLGSTGSDLKTATSTLTGTIPSLDIGDDKIWSGQVDGQDWPDTNLDQLLGHIDDLVLGGDLVVEGEVIEPQPVPTPVPTYPPPAPDIPLQDVPWGGLNDLIGSSTGTIDDAIQDQTDAITGAQEGTTEAVESLTDTIEGALDTPSTEELLQFKFDLRELFPFCIPFDIYRLLSSFDAEPVAPHVQLPIVIQSIGFLYNLDLDLSVWNPVAQAMRTAELIVYAIALAWATGKVIKW